jgi:hypothetical protein
VAFDAILKDMHVKGFAGGFPIRIGTLEARPPIHNSQHSEKEMVHYHLFPYTNISHFDPYDVS